MNHLTSQLRANRAKDQKGFTLIELLVVIVILGILAAVVVFSVGGIQGRGEKSACDATRKTVLTASETYRAQNTAYATDLNDLKPFVSDFTPLTATTFKAGDKTLTYTPGTSSTSSSISAC